MSWFVFAIVAILLLDVVDLAVWGVAVPAAALMLYVAVPAARPTPAIRTVDRRDLVAIAGIYIVVVGLLRLAFSVFTTDRVAGLFLCFAAGLVVGVAAPVAYTVWIRGGTLHDLGLGAHNIRMTGVLGLTLAAVQFAMTLWGYSLPAAAEWVPLLVMSVVVGFFEAVFFRGFVQNRLEASFGTAGGLAGAALLYSLYHLGYGMGGEEMVFLFGLGVVYAIAFRIAKNALVLWPLLTPIGAFFNNLDSGDIDLPWASIAGFADVALVMAAVIWFAHRHERKRAGSQARRGAPATPWLSAPPKAVADPPAAQSVLRGPRQPRSGTDHKVGGAESNR